MKNILFNSLVGLTIVLGLLSACDSKPKDGRTDTYHSGDVTFYCDESFYPIIDEQVETFMFVENKRKKEGDELAIVTPIYTDESTAIDSLLEGNTMLAITTRNFKQKEIDYLKQKKYKPRAFIVAYDGVAIIINNHNPDSVISVKDFKRILTGDVTKWKEIYPESKLGDLDVVFDNPKSSIVHFCEDSILGGKPITNPNITAVNKSDEVINYVHNHPEAMGIIGSNWINDKGDTTNITFNKDVRVMRVSRFDDATAKNSRQPYQYYLYDGTYPFTRAIYAMVIDTQLGLCVNFGQHLFYDRGQRVFLRAGLLPVQAGITTRDVIVSK